MKTNFRAIRIAIYLMLLFAFSSTLFSQITDTGNNVGIGISNPIAKLHNNSGADNNYAAILATSTLGNNLVVSSQNPNTINTSVFKIEHEFFGSSRNNGYMSFQRGTSSDNGFLTFGTSGLERLKIDANGLVGIGTNNPKAKLEISAEGSPSNNEFEPTNGVMISGTDQVLYMGVNSASHVSYIQSVDYATDVAHLLLNARGGNVGIGSTTIPTSPLSVVGRVAIASKGIYSQEAYNGSVIITKPTASGQYINLIRDGQYPWSIGTIYNSNEFAIGTGMTNDAAFTTPYFIINTSGNVGIGTTTPDYTLDVNGVIRAKEIKVNLNDGADFVFEEGYKLKPIQEVSEFVKTNKHLPDVPAAADMVKNGVDMGEFQVKLLQKVEELTLYVAQQDKKIKELESLINK